MTPEHHKPKYFPSDSPLKSKGKVVPVNKRKGEIDVGEELSGFGLQGLKVTDQELADLVADLGLDGEDAGNLVKSLSSNSNAPTTKSHDAKETTSETKPSS